MMMKYQAAIFDMDGLLLDTERIALNTFIEACRACYFEPDIDVYMRCIGTIGEKTREILTAGYGRDFPYTAVEKIWSEKYERAITDNSIPLKLGVMDLLDYLKQSRVKMAVATSTEYERACKKLHGTGVGHYFKIIVGGDQVEKGKPDPEIYLKVAGLLNEEPTNCLVFEDSDNGVLSAHKAGMNVIQVPDLKEPSDAVINLGHPILPSLRDVKHFLEDGNDRRHL